MKFKKYLNESRLEKVLNDILSKYINENITEGDCLNKLKSAISEFIEILEFKPIIDSRKIGITINGEFRGGDNGSKHIVLNCIDKKQVDSIVSDLNKNINTINSFL